MYPEIFHLSFLHTYGVLVAAAFLTALWMTSRLAREFKLDSESVTNLGIYAALAAIAGAKLMMFVVDFRYYAEHPAEIFSWNSIQAGGVFYGGLIAALAVAWWYMRRRRLPFARTADVFAPGVALGHAIGRIGCFSAGCCWGIACNRTWAVTFTNPVSNELVGVPLNVPLHPTQLYESAAEFLIFGVLYWRIHRPHTAGAIIGLYLMLYSIARFIVEFFREHQQGNVLNGPFDASQILSIVLFAVGAWLYARSLPRPAEAPAR